MKFLVDAQLPRRLARLLSALGHDTLHTLDLPRGNRTQDAEIIAIALEDDRIVVTKDDDFVQSFWVQDRPKQLLLVSTGNIANADLDRLAMVLSLGPARSTLPPMRCMKRYGKMGNGSWNDVIMTSF